MIRDYFLHILVFADCVEGLSQFNYITEIYSPSIYFDNWSFEFLQLIVDLLHGIKTAMKNMQLCSELYGGMI